MIKQFNESHFILLGIVLGIAFFLCLIVFLLRKKRKVTWTIIMILLLTAFTFHWLRLPFPPGGFEFPFAYQFITFLSICAVNVVVFPFIFLSKNKTLRDYMFYVGFLGGIFAAFMPINAYGREMGSFDTIAFFVTHGILMTVPLLMVISGHHRLSWRRTWRPAFVLLSVLCIILVNEILLLATGIVDYDAATFFSSDVRNEALIFGLEPHVGVLGQVFEVFCPDVFKVALFDVPSAGISKGDKLYWPIVWLILPLVIYVTVVCFLMSLIFDAKRFGRDMKLLFTGRKSTKLGKIKPGRND